MLWGIAEFVCRKAFPGNALSKAFFTAAVTALLSSVLLITGFFAGFSFFGIKLSCYYLPFFLLGCVFPHFRSALRGKRVCIMGTDDRLRFVDCIFLPFVFL